MFLVHIVQKPYLALRQPSARQRGRVGQHEEAAKTEDDGHEALNDEDPSPGLVVPETVHFGNRGCQQTGKRPGDRGGAIKDGHADLREVWRVPLADEEDGTGEETGPA